MYSSNDDQYTNKTIINPREINITSQYYISSNNNNNNLNKFLIHSNNYNNNEPYLFQDTITISNPTHAQSSSINNNEEEIIIKKDNNEEEEEEEDQEVEIRRLKRMQSNRESARRSRMRKRKQLESLQNQVDQLLTINHQLGEKLSQVMENNCVILQENSQLKQQVALLQKNVNELIMSIKGGGGGGGAYGGGLLFEEVGGGDDACNNNHQIRASQTNSTSVDNNLRH